MAPAGGTGRWAHWGRPEENETWNGAGDAPVTGTTWNERDWCSFALTTTPHAPRPMDAPEKRHTQTGTAPESRNVNPNRLAKTASAERGTPPGHAGPEHTCRPPVTKPTSVVLRKHPPMASPPWAVESGPPGGLVRGFLRLAGGTGEAPRPRASGAGGAGFATPPRRPGGDEARHRRPGAVQGGRGAGADSGDGTRARDTGVPG